MRQVISIDPSGAILSLKHKRGEGVDLRSIAHEVSIKRATLIEWDEARQAWEIVWCDGIGPDGYRGAKWTEDLFRRTGVDYSSLGGHPPADGSQAVAFDDYEDAVRAEVAVIQSLQRQGCVRELH